MSFDTRRSSESPKLSVRGRRPQAGLTLFGWSLLISTLLSLGLARSSEAIPTDSVTQVVGGRHFSCALTLSSQVYCSGQPFSANDPVLASGALAGVVEIAGARASICARTLSGDVYCWGGDTTPLGNGQTTLGASESPVQVVGLPGAALSIAVGRFHACAVISGGSVWCLGENGPGSRAVAPGASTRFFPTPVQVPGLPSDVIQITSGDGHTCARAVSGAVWCWGDNDDGQVAGTFSSEREPPTEFFTASSISRVVAGHSHNCAIDSVGALTCWGADDENQLGPTTPITDVVDVALGTTHTCATFSTGNVSCWGLNSHGQLGDGTLASSAIPVNTLVSDVASLGSGSDHSCAVNTSNELFCWGSNAYGALGTGASLSQVAPAQMTHVATPVTDVSLTENSICTVGTAGMAHCWQGGVGSFVVSIPGVSFVEIAGGRYHTCARDTVGAVYCWGLNFFGQLGNGTNIDSLTTPVSVLGIPTFVESLASGEDHMCAVVTGGNLYCWGHNTRGALGDGTTAHRDSAVLASDLTVPVVSASGGRYHTCALSASGAAICWGANNEEQLGFGPPEMSYFPPAVVPGFAAGVATVETGLNTTCAALDSGQTYCWGQNDHGLMGLGYREFSTNYGPTAPIGLVADINQLVAAYQHACALDGLGNVYCWGSLNLAGTEAAAPSIQGVVAPVAAEISNIVHLEGHDSRTCGIDSAGALYCWGRDIYPPVGTDAAWRGSIPREVTPVPEPVWELGLLIGSGYAAAIGRRRSRDVVPVLFSKSH